MRDQDIRCLVHSRLLHRHHSNADTIVIDELGINHGRSRIDIAILNGHISSIEIKAASDTLKRLENQIESYNQISNEARLIVAANHLDNSLKLVPDWWGVTLVDVGTRGGIFFESVRRTGRNPQIDMMAVARLLWRPEAQAMMSEFGATRKEQRQPREQLYEWLTTNIPEKHLARSIQQTIKLRKNWRYHQPLLQSDDSSQRIARS